MSLLVVFTYGGAKWVAEPEPRRREGDRYRGPVALFHESRNVRAKWKFARMLPDCRHSITQPATGRPKTSSHRATNQPPPRCPLCSAPYVQCFNHCVILLVDRVYLLSLLFPEGTYYLLFGGLFNPLIYFRLLPPLLTTFGQSILTTGVKNGLQCPFTIPTEGCSFHTVGGEVFPKWQACDHPVAL
jgi:hypothetical protein